MKNRKVNIEIDIFFLMVVLIIIAIGGNWFKNSEKTENDTYDFLILEKDAEVSAMYFDGEHVYVGTNDGIHIYDAQSKKMVDTIENISMVYTAGIVGDNEGGIWVGHEGGLTHIDGTMKQENFEYPQIPEGRVNTVALKDNVVYCGTYNGAAKLQQVNGQWTVTDILNHESGLLCDSVNVILPVDSGIFYFSYLDANGGITFISNSGEIRYWDIKSGIPHPYITSAVEDADGKIWVGMGYMRDGGLMTLVEDETGYQICDSFSVEDGIPGEKVRCLFIDDSTFWVTTEYDGILIKVKEDGKDWAEYRNLYLTQESGLSDNEIKCMIKVKDSYWLGGKYGLTIVPKNIV